MNFLTNLEYKLLKHISPEPPDVCSGASYDNRSKLKVLLGEDLLSRVFDKPTVVDFGCGEGGEAIELAHLGAERVVGIDIREDVLDVARERAEDAGVGDRCVFTTSAEEKADVMISIDAFEHFENPERILNVMDDMLKPDGELLVSFGPTWYHPNGGHLFSVFPWAHILFSESALIRWRSHFRCDGATRFSEVSGGLNQMTIGRFEKLIRQSPFQFADLDLVPIRKLKPFHNTLTREMTTSIVRCRLVKRN